jgi:hypothetical protein
VLILSTLSGGALLTLDSLLLVRALRVTGPAARTAAGLVCAGAIVVGLAWLLTPLHAFSRWPVLGGEAAIAAVVLAACPRSRELPRLPRLRITALGLTEGPTAVLLAAAVIALTVQLGLGLAVAPNEPDSMLYHLPRAALIAQRHTALPPAPVVAGDPASGNPPNAELLVGWTMIMSGGDGLAASVQWLALIGLAAVVAAAALLLTFPPAGALFAGAVVVLMPEPLLQAATPQNDLLLAFLAGAAALFAARGLRERSRGHLVVAALALGLATGTKGTVLFLLPAIALLVGAAAVSHPPPRRPAAFAVAVSVAALAALGAPGYVANLARTGNLTGGTDGSIDREFAQDGPLRDLARVSWSTLLDAPGLAPHAVQRLLADPARDLFAGAHGSYFEPPAKALQAAVDEDTAALGLVGLLVLLPVIAVSAFGRRAPRARRLTALSALTGLACFALTLGYSPDDGRLVMPALLLAAPLLAAVASRRRLAWPVAALAIAGAVPCLVANPGRRLIRGDGEPSALTLTRSGQQLMWFDREPPVLAALGRAVSPRAPLAWAQTRDFTDSEWTAYPLFGRRLERRAIPLPPSSITPAELRRRGLAGAVVFPARCKGPGCTVSARGMLVTPLGEGVALLRPGP